MDLEEMKCSLCKELYNETNRTPMLLPACGHSVCLQCLSEQVGIPCEQMIVESPGFEPQETGEPLDSARSSQTTPVKKSAKLIGLETKEMQLAWERDPSNKSLTFKCPEDGVESNFDNPHKLPKNFAIIKVLKRQTCSQFDQEEERPSLANFLGSPTTSPRGRQETRTFFAKTQSGEEEQKEAKQRKSTNFMETFAKTREELKKKKAQVAEKTFGICKDHERPQELVCLSGCKVRVCPHCALFGAHKGHDVREEAEVQGLISEHSKQLEQMVDQMSTAKVELTEPKFYWEYANKYRDKKAKLKEQIQNDFKHWRKTLRQLEMKVLDQLHSIHFAEFEEQFTQARQENQSLLVSVTALIDDTSQMLQQTAQQRALNKHFIEYELTDPETLDLLLTRAEGMLESILNIREFSQLRDLEESYSKIKVDFDADFEAKVAKLIDIEGVVPKKKERDRSASNKREQVQTISALPSFIDDTAQLNLQEELKDMGLSRSGFEPPGLPDVSVISSSSEQKRAHLQYPLHQPALRQSQVGGHFALPNQPPDFSDSSNSSQRNRSPSAQQFAQATADSSNSHNNSYGQSNDRHQRMFAYNQQSSARMSHQLQISDTNMGMSGMLSPQNISPRQFQTSQSPKAMPSAAFSPRAQEGFSGINLVPTDKMEQKPQNLAKSLGGVQKGGKKVSKESAITTAFRTEINEGVLRLSGRGIGDNNINEINKNLAQTQWLKELNLQGNKITDKGIENLAKTLSSSNIQIETINLSNNKLSEKCIEPLAAVLRLAKGVRGIDMRGNGITSRVTKNKLKNSLNWMDIIFD